MIKTPLSTVIGGAFWTPGATIIGSTSATINTIIKSLFANGEQGFTRTLDDYSILFQDAVGTIPVTAVGQPVGLMLDKSKGLVLGSELVINGNFTNGTTGWNSINGTDEVVSGGYLNFINASTSNPNVGQQVGVQTSKFYNISFRIAKYASGGVYFVLYSVSGSVTKVTATYSANGVYTIMLDAPFDATGYMGIRTTAAATTLSITDISIKELAGNHAYQSTTSQRPIYQDNPKRVDYDGVDDNLITTLPAQLTNCTVIRAIPNVGTQILTNQTIPATYTDNTDHCGLIVINRALTVSETAQITKLFNKAAGV